MIDKKELFNDWAPREGRTWTKFAKPGLFMHTEDARFTWINETAVPIDIRNFNNDKTAIIVDLPGADSVETGLGLARAGFRPVPLYNGIHEPKNGGLHSVVDNAPIIDALAAGTDTLRSIVIDAKAPPAFLLDANRDVQPPVNVEDMYDNRWGIDLDDMPDAAYMKDMGISRVVVWSDRDIQNDVKEIVSGYHHAGIEIVTYIKGKVAYTTTGFFDTDIPKDLGVKTEVKEAVRKFENARFGLLLVIIMASINLIGMFAGNAEPLLWTAPSIMWLTYLWVVEIVGDVFAIGISVVYLMLYLLSHRKRSLIKPAFVLFGLDTLVFYIYVLYYGIAAFTGYSFVYGLVVFTLPVVMISFIARGALAYNKLEAVSDDDYAKSLDDIDGYTEGIGGHYGPRRRIFRPYRGVHYRGFSGYGGTGRGGYSGRGGGYGGYGGFGG